jgi:membrane fusion protein (multidrug efflux system)
MGVKVAFHEAGTVLDVGAVAGSGGVAETGLGVAIPPTGLRRDNGRDIVFVVGNDGTVERRAVNVESQNDNEVIITSGIASGERIVVEGPANLADGDTVTEVRS